MADRAFDRGGLTGDGMAELMRQRGTDVNHPEHAADVADRATTTEGARNVARVGTLQDAITNAFPEPLDAEGEPNAEYTVKPPIAAQLDTLLNNKDRNGVHHDHQALDTQLFGSEGLLTNYTFNDYWNDVAPKDEAGNPEPQPEASTGKQRFTNGPSQSKRGEDTAAINQWQNDNADWMQAYKSYHKLVNTAKDLVHTSREVHRLVPKSNEDVDSRDARANQRDLVSRTSKAVSAAIHAQHQQQPNMFGTVSWLSKALNNRSADTTADQESQTNLATLLGMPCDNEAQALALLDKCHEIMDAAFNKMGLIDLPNGGYKLPINLDSPKGLKRVITAMAARDGVYKRYSVNPSKRISASGTKAIFQEAIDSHFTDNPWSVQINSAHPKTQPQQNALQWLQKEMDAPAAEGGKKLKDCSAAERSQAILGKLADAKQKHGGKLPKTLQIVQKSLLKAYIRQGSKPGYFTNTTPVTQAEKQLGAVTRQFHSVTEAVNGSNEGSPARVNLTKHGQDLRQEQRHLTNKHDVLQQVQKQLKGNVSSAKWNKRGQRLKQGAKRITPGLNSRDARLSAENHGADEQVARESLQTFNADMQLLDLDAGATYQDMLREPTSGMAPDNGLDEFVADRFAALRDVGNPFAVDNAPDRDPLAAADGDLGHEHVDDPGADSNVEHDNSALNP